jgi:hypothetical protein
LKLPGIPEKNSTKLQLEHPRLHFARRLLMFTSTS